MQLLLIFCFCPAQERLIKAAAYRFSKPLVGDDGRVYTCLERNLLAFESNGSIAWTLSLNYTCSAGIAPVHGGARKVPTVISLFLLLRFCKNCLRCWEPA